MMEINESKNNKTDNKFKSRSKSLPNNNFEDQVKTEQKSKNSNMFSSISKKTPAFNQKRFHHISRTSKRLLTQTVTNDNILKIQNPNIKNQLNKSQEISMHSLHNKSDLNLNCTNINISIVNPNFSINNIEQRYSVANTNNNKINLNIINNSLLSFNDNNSKIEVKNDSKTKTEIEKAKILSSIYKDYLENKSQDESFPANFGDDLKEKKFKNYLKENKIVQHEYKSKGIIAGFSAYMYQNEEIINRDKICLNINIDKSKNNDDKKDEVDSSHIINYFSLFCGGKDDINDELPKRLANQLKDTILKNERIINYPVSVIKKCIFNSEIDFINYFTDERKNIFLKQNEIKIPHCSLTILLNIDNMLYIANIGKITTILSSNYSKNINYLTRENSFHKISNDEINEKNIKTDIENINNNNFDEQSSNDINGDKSSISFLFNSISNKIFPQLNLIRSFPGSTMHKYLNKKYNINCHNITSYREIYDRYKKRSSSALINILNDLSQKKKSKSICYKSDNFNNLKIQSSNSSKYMPFIPKTNNLVNPNTNEPPPEHRVISSYPDTLSFKYESNHDFILICSKIILDNISYDYLCKGVYETMKKCIRKSRSFEIFLGCVVKDIIKKSISSGITTNISCIFICFESIKTLYLKHDINSVEKELVSFYLTSNHTKKFGLYENVLTSDFFDLDKAYKYENKLKNKIDKINKKKSVLSAINSTHQKKIFYNNFINNDSEITKKLYSKDKKKKKSCKCCCIVF